MGPPRDFGKENMRARAIAGYYSFLEALPLGICVLNPDGSVHYVNVMANALFGDAGIPGSCDARRKAAPAYIAGTEELFPPDNTPAFRALAGHSSKRYTLDVQVQQGRIPLEMWGDANFES